MNVNLRVALALFVGVLLGALVFEGYKRMRPEVEVPPTEIQSLVSKVSEVSGNIDLVQRMVLELQANVLLGQNSDRAKPAAEAAIAAAKSEGLPAPSVEEVVDGKLEAHSKNEIDTSLHEQVDSMNKSMQDEGMKGVDVSNCKDLFSALANQTDKSAALTSPGTVEKLKACKGQIDSEKKRLEQEYKDMGCDADPTKEGCGEKRKQIEKADDFDKVVKLILIAAAIYFMVNGDLATGLLLLSMANGMGAGSGSGGGSEGTRQGAGQTAQASNDEKESPGRGILGTGGTIVCDKSRRTILACQDTKNPSRRVEIDPEKFEPSADAGSQDAKAALTASINDSRGASLTLCESGKQAAGIAFIKGFVLSKDGRHYLIRATPENEGFGVVLSYPPRHSADEQKCISIDERP